MMRGMQHAPPEDPDSLPPHVEEWDGFQPPRFIARRQAFQPCFAQILILAPESFRGKVPGQKRGRFGFVRQSDELAEKSSFRQQLMFHDLVYRTRFFIRLEPPIFPPKPPPSLNDFP